MTQRRTFRRTPATKRFTLALLGLLSAASTPAAADTVLERVIASYGNPMLTGVFANAALASFNPLGRDPAFAVIDGTISNTIYGVTIPDIDSDVYALEAMNSINGVEVVGEDALSIGGVNTGRIVLDRLEDVTAGVSTGSNMALDQAKTATSDASSMQLAQLGGSFESAVLVLNIAATQTAVRGRVDNRITNIGGRIGQITSTAIGAVNTGEIQSGVSDVVNRITGP